jgi:DNA-directed RNA polymerase specialized sigma24 family protein
MKTGRYSAEEEQQHEIVLAQIAQLLRLRHDLSYPQIAKQFDCSTSMVEKVAKMAGLTKTRKTGRKPAAQLHQW